ncbi:MAG: endolytic transglycosylase MltG [Alphaproteobacteria bacterium]|nr:endolytic transglycosylase MltG [Alphaproteobacteria bacterium]
MKQWKVGLSFLGVLSILASLMIVFLSINNFYSPGSLKTPTTVIIPVGQSLEGVSKTLAKANIISQPWLFTLQVRLRGEGTTLKAGEYLFSAHVSPQEILAKMLKGDCVVHQFTVPEGLTTREILQMLNLKNDLKNEIKTDLQDGQLLPETYHYTLKADRNLIVERMQEAMRKTLQMLWARRRPGLPFKSPQEALILASIVEKETGLAHERPRIAGVFMNRLRKGMPLQSDPTVAYGCFHLAHKPHKTLSHVELRQPTPYNTYINIGLPPTPICNPGKEAIQAVLHPLETQELYFVADGTGGHVFSITYKEHQKHHQNWRKLAKQRKQS